MPYNIAQFNVAWLKEPLDHPSIAEFEQAIDPLHQDADLADGFIWRLIADGTDSATTLRPLGDDGIINFTVWESKEAMAQWVYKRGHADALKKRRNWFFPPLESNVVMWWVPQDSLPTLDEAIMRLQYLRSFGSSPLAFLYKDKFSPQDAESFLNDKNNRPLDLMGIHHRVAERTLDKYIDGWNTKDAIEQKMLFAQTTTDNVKYTNPDTQCGNREELKTHISASRKNTPSRKIIRSTRIDVHHYSARFGWRVDAPDGNATHDNFDTVDFTEDGRIKCIISFNGALMDLQ